MQFRRLLTALLTLMGGFLQLFMTVILKVLLRGQSSYLIMFDTSCKTINTCVAVDKFESVTSKLPDPLRGGSWGHNSSANRFPPSVYFCNST